MAHSTFISHSSKNKLVAEKICAALERAGQKCWIAPRDIRSGESWPAAIAAAVSVSEVMVLVFSAHANESKDVANEVVLAMEAGIPVLPVKIENVEPKGVLQYYLAGAQWQVVNNPPIEYQLLSLAKTVEKTIINLPERRKAAELKMLSESTKPKSAWQVWKEQRHPLIWITVLLTLALLAGTWLYKNYNTGNGIAFNQGQQEQIPSDFVGRQLLEYYEVTEDWGNLGGNLINGGFVVSYGDHVYYLNRGRGRVRKINLDGYEKKIVTSVDAYSLNIVDNWLFYLNHAEEGKIYKLNLDGLSGEENIGNKLLDDHTDLIMVVGSWIYYINSSHENRLYRVRTDGSERSRLSTDPAGQLYVAENHVYFTNQYDHNKIYRVGLDGRGLYALQSDSARSIQVVDGWIYYINESKADLIYKVNTEGYYNQNVIEDRATQFIVFEEMLYYLDKQGIVKEYDLITNKTEQKTKIQPARLINVCEPWLYFVELGSDHVFRTSLQGDDNAEPVD